jgi:hypothetical protein
MLTCGRFSRHMVNSISSAQVSQASEAAKAATPKPQSQAQQPSSLASDKVTLKSAGGGDVDHDGDSH